jgi:hypothetical protein
MAVGLAAGMAGCSGNSATPTTAALSNPSDIVMCSLTSFASSTTVHLDGTLGGSVNATALNALLGGGGLGLSGTININGATVTGDVDLSMQAVHVKATFPSLFATTVDVFLVDGYTYTKISLFGSKYHKSQAQAPVSASASSPGASSASSPATVTLLDAIDQLRTRLGMAISTSTLVGRDAVDGREAYHVVMNVPDGVLSEAVGAVAGDAPAELAVGLAPVDYWVYRDGLQPARLGLSATSARLGNVKTTLTLTGYGRPVRIQAPADSQVEAG